MSGPRRHHYTRWPLVEGYAERQSVIAGEPITVHVASRAPSFAVEMVRIGRSQTVVWRRGGLTADDHPVPERAWAEGCDWPPAFTIGTDPAWPSGLYEIRFTAEGVGQEALAGDERRATSEAFVVLQAADGGAPNRPLLVLATNTWQAYNQWGGRCYYSGADHVSFQRPIERGYLRRHVDPDGFDGRIANVAVPSDPEHHRLQTYQATGEYPLWTASAGWWNWERRFVRWAESAGIDLDYAVNADLDDPVSAAAAIGRHRVAVSVGHDEYWTWGMRDALDGFVDGGGRWAVLSGNTCFWQVRYDGSTMVGYRGRAHADDPVLGTDRRQRLTSMWSDPAVGRPETRTTGLTFTRGGYHRIGRAVPNGAGAYTVHRPDHWLLEGTGLHYGDRLGADAGIVGYEVDGCAIEMADGLPRPSGVDGAPTDADIVATAPARLISITDDVCEAPEALWASIEPPGDLEGTAMVLFGRDWRDHVEEIGRGHAVLTAFDRGAGSVVNVGTTDWAYGLDADPAVQRITGNLLRRFLA
ncbi:MAG: N,N-dimethylformamidase beta subunit family domain-containing protein [Actinomycetota bacterium]